MPDQSFLTLNGAKIIATANQARMANSVMRLFKFGFLPDITTPLATFVENECDFAGYDAITIAAWSAPVLAGASWATYAPTQTFRWTAEGENVGNQVGGHFIVTAGGELIDFAIYDPSIPVQGPGQAVVKTPIEVTVAG